MMNCQTMFSNQRLKGCYIKQALHLALLLAISVWLLYQPKHLSNEKAHSGVSIAIKLSEEQVAVILGRKGHAGWSNIKNNTDSDSDLDSDSVNVNFTGENEKTEDDNGDFLNIGHKKGLASILDQVEQADGKEQEKGEAGKGSDEDEDVIKMKLSSGVVNDTSSGTSGIIIEDFSFHDENGIPEDVKDESLWTELSDDRRTSLDRGSSSDNESRILESIQAEDLVKSKGGRVNAYVGTESKSTLEDSKIAAVTINSEESCCVSS